MKRITFGAIALVLLSLTALAAHAQSCRVPPELTRTRPAPEGAPTPVEVGIYLVDLRRIDDSQQYFDADVLLNLSWTDPRLTVDVSGVELEGCRVPLSSVWNPEIAVINERRVSQRFDDTVAIGPGGAMRYRQRLQGEFSTPLDLHDFPLDSQRLGIRLVATRATPEEVDLRIDAERSDTSEVLTIPDWETGEATARIEPWVSPRHDLTRAGMLFELTVVRKIQFYLWKVLLPLCLIVLMSWAGFWINPEVFPPKVGVATSSVLTLIAFQFSLGYLLPRLSYLTRADRFLMGSMLLVFLALGEALLAGALAKKGRLEAGLRLDRWVRWPFLVGFAAVMAFAFWL